MIYSKPHATLKEQVQRLRERGLIIDDEQRAEHFLSIAGYYRISSYCYRFEFPPVDGKRTHQFKEGTRFDDIIRVYVFDQKLRTLILNSLEDFVTTYKTACLQFVPFHCAAGKTAV